MKGLEHCSRFVDTLLEAGIRPWCTMYHWDLPQALEDRGGWPNRNLASYFADYASTLAKHLGDRVTVWAPFNMPWAIAFMGYAAGAFPPCPTSFSDFLKATHTLALAQAEALRAVKAASPQATVGSAYEMAPAYPKTDSDGDREAAARYHAMNNVFFLEAAMHGRYPKAFVGEPPYELMGFKAGDEKLLFAPLDWVGFHYYTRRIVADASKERFLGGGNFSGTEIESNAPGGRDPSTGRRTLYDVLQVPCAASPGELRVAFKLRQLELEAKHCPRSEYVLLERAFNILGDPGLRACYDALLKYPDAPALFPYGGFGSLLVSGELSRDAQTFFARRIIAFLPEWERRRFHAPLRKCEFYSDRALYRDIRGSLELWIDPAVLHQVWDATWNRWKHLFGAKMEVNASFVKSGKYRWHASEWQLVTWETALPSRLEIKLPSDFAQQVEAAKRTYQPIWPVFTSARQDSLPGRAQTNGKGGN
jgi:hypothetical protein